MTTAEVGHNNCRAMMRRMIRFFVYSGVLLLAGCAAGNYGYLKRSPDVTRAFETYQVFPEHRYYYLNQENNPYAVVALQNNYRLKGNLWREFDPRSGKLEKIVGLVKAFPVNYAYLGGSTINDHTENQIGYWYSSLRIRSITVDDANNSVSIFTDTPWLRDDERGRGFWFRMGSYNSGRCWNGMDLPAARRGHIRPACHKNWYR